VRKVAGGVARNMETLAGYAMARSSDFFLGAGSEEDRASMLAEKVLWKGP
jgi:hypothetical protein